MRINPSQVLGMLCAICAALTAIAAPHDYFLVLVQYLVVCIVTLPAVLAITVAVAGYVENPAAPMRGAMYLFRRSPKLRAARIVLFFLAGMAAYTTLKFRIPDIVPYYADPYLADWDDFLHGGPPWWFLHHLPRRATSAVVDFFYSMVWFGQWFGILLFVALWKGHARKERYLWALALSTLFVGALLAVACSSVGPIFYDRFYGGTRFAGLTTELQGGEGPPTVVRFARYLLESYNGKKIAFGTGISAMPSMHIAIVTLNALFLGSLRRVLGIVGLTFLAIMQFGSVYTGWHYAVDGYVSIVAVTLIWWLTGLYFLRDQPVAKPVKPAVRPKSQPARPATPKPKPLTGGAPGQAKVPR